MRHRKAGKRLGRDTAHRKAMLRNMVASLFTHSQIRTTDAKAKELKGIAEDIITLAKRGDIHARRQVFAAVRDKIVVKKLFDEMRESFLDRPGGYTRITKVGIRPGDAAPVSVVEILKSAKEEKAAKKAAK